MAADLFDFVADLLQGATPLDRLEARGTLRIVLKSAGLEPRSLTLDQVKVVFEKLMPGELDQRGVPEPWAACVRVVAELSTSWSEGESSSGDLDAIFGRLGGDSVDLPSAGRQR